VRTNKLLQRRYYLLHAARDAGVFGLLVGTLGASSYLPLLAHLRRIIKRAGRKSYTVCVGKLNPAKLGNFAEVQAWVLVACPEGSLVDSKVRALTRPRRSEVTLADGRVGLPGADRDAVRAPARARARARVDGPLRARL
jgi:diphthamide biosynthesis protein 2